MRNEPLAIAAPKVVALPLYANYYRAAAVAASLILMLGTSVYFYKNNFGNNKNSDLAAIINPDTAQNIIHTKQKTNGENDAPATIPQKNTQLAETNYD